MSLLFAGLLFAGPARAQDVLVFASIDEIIDWFESEEFWGEVQRDQQLDVPYVMLTGINPRWRNEAQSLPVQYKKEIFYRAMLPLVLHANAMVLDRRRRMEHLRDDLADGKRPDADDMALLRDLAVLLRVIDDDDAALLTPQGSKTERVVEALLYKLDIIPAGLALGQAAYESGYGTSRFAVEGNALFGQWTYGGKGLVPEQQRKNLGDHRIAAFDWPFDSVRGYFINLMSHPAYEPFRKLRSSARADGRPIDSLEMADGLIHYSERGQAYVDTLKGMIRVNKLDIADDAVFRDEPMRFAIGADGDARAGELRAQIDAMRAAGEIDAIIRRMRLDGGRSPATVPDPLGNDPRR